MRRRIGLRWSGFGIRKSKGNNAISRTNVNTGHMPGPCVWACGSVCVGLWEWTACPLWDTRGVEGSCVTPLLNVGHLLRSRSCSEPRWELEGGSLQPGVGGGWAGTVVGPFPDPGGRKPWETLRLQTTSIHVSADLCPKTRAREGA